MAKMIHRYEYMIHGLGNAGRGVCELTFHVNDEIERERLHVVEARELADNPGRSITNAAGDIARQVCNEYHLDPKRLVWIEHYDAGSYRNHVDDVEADAAMSESFSLVGFDAFWRPSWEPMLGDDFRRLGLPVPPRVIEEDRRQALLDEINHGPPDSAAPKNNPYPETIARGGSGLMSVASPEVQTVDAGSSPIGGTYRIGNGPPIEGNETNAALLKLLGGDAAPPAKSIEQVGEAIRKVESDAAKKLTAKQQRQQRRQERRGGGNAAT